MSMTTQHTPEPWAFESANLATNNDDLRKYAERVYSTDPGPDRDFTIAFVRDVDSPTRKANTRRIVACVNACAGLSTEMLEQVGSIVARSGLRLRDCEMQRDELAAALRGMLFMYDNYEQSQNGAAIVESARAALAKIKEEA